MEFFTQFYEKNKNLYGSMENENFVKNEENKKTLSSIKKDSVLINMNINTVQNNSIFRNRYRFLFFASLTYKEVPFGNVFKYFSISKSTFSPLT